MKKKILFLCSNMNIGGFQKSLINLLHYFDYERYDVDLFLLEKNCLLEKYIDKRVNILYACETTADYCISYKESFKKLLVKGHIFLLLKRSYNALLSLLDKGKGGKYMSKQIEKIQGEYDCCIDYCGQFLNYYMIDNISAKKKITYFHNDYLKWPYYKSMDELYYPKADYIVTVSEECVNSLKKVFPNIADKVVCVENIITKETIEMVDDIFETPKEYEKGVITFVSVGRLVPDKGVDIGIEAAALLKNQFKTNFRWLWVGPGNKKEYYDLIEKYNLISEFILVGGKANPYSYMEKADCIVHPARFEGKAVAVEEALVMNKPIVATSYSTVHNQIKNGITGLICSMDAKSLANTIIRIMDNDLKENIIENQKKMCKGNEAEATKMMKLIEG